LDALLYIRSLLSAAIGRLHRALGFVSPRFPGRADVPSPDELHGAWRSSVWPRRAASRSSASVVENWGRRGRRWQPPGNVACPTTSFECRRLGCCAGRRSCAECWPRRQSASLVRRAAL